MSNDGFILVSAPYIGYKYSSVAEDTAASIVRVTKLAQVDAESEGITFLQRGGAFITNVQCKTQKINSHY
jgi:hypothetical protein